MLYPNQRMLIGINTAFSALALASVAVRFATIRARRLRPAHDDWACFIAMLSNIGQFTIVYLMILNGGAGKPPNETTPGEVAEFLKLTAIAQFFYGITMGGTRASITLLVMYIFSTSKMVRYICQATLALTAAWTLFVILQTFAMCRPFAANWDKTIPGAVCGDQSDALLAIVIWGLILDLAIFITPIPQIWSLHMPANRKIVLTLLFSIGLFDIVAGVMRLVVTVAGVFNVVTSALLWVTLEASIAIFVACAPKCRQSLELLFPKGLVSTISMRYLLRSKSTHRSRSRADTSKDSPNSSNFNMSSLNNRSDGQRAFSAVTSSDATDVHVPTADGQVAVTKDVYVYREDMKHMKDMV